MKARVAFKSQKSIGQNSTLQKRFEFTHDVLRKKSPFAFPLTEKGKPIFLNDSVKKSLPGIPRFIIKCFPTAGCDLACAFVRQSMFYVKFRHKGDYILQNTGS